MDVRPAPAPDDALAQPTRRRLFALLEQLRRPAGTAELAERLALHPNGVRAHLERLEGAGLVARARVRQPRGRPRDAWTIAEGARPGGEPPSGHAQLAQWLARATPATPARLRETEAVGREIGRELAPRDATGAPRETLHATLVALGFQPHESEGAPGTVGYCLGNCPYREAVRANQSVVCTLHRGITRGLLDVVDPEATLDEFVPQDPDAAGCLIQISRAGSTPR